MALVVKNLPADVGDIRDAGSIPGLGRFPGGGHGNPLHYSWLENPMDRGAWQATYSSQGRKELNMTEAMAKKKYSFPPFIFSLFKIL